MTGHIYTLQLEGGNYYVGYSDDVMSRVAQHFLSKGALWTRVHKPVRVLSVVPGDKHLEDVTTIALMAAHGFRRVRGGSWTSLELRILPSPLARARCMKPPRELPTPKEPSSYDYEAHVIDVVERSGGVWQARVTGPLAAVARPARGIMSFRAPTKDDAKSQAEAWISVGLGCGEGHESEGEDEAAGEEVKDGEATLDST